MRIAIAQLDYHIGNFESNSSKIIDHIQKAKEWGADLVIFAELAVCGYPPRDFLDFNNFIELSYNVVKQIAKHCHDIAAIVGAPSINPSLKGKALFNSAYYLNDGIVQQVIHKTLLPTYDVFDEYRYFEPNNIFECITLKGHKIALTICEDLWNIDDNPLYILNPMDELIKQKPEFAINIAASPFSYSHDKVRTMMLACNAAQYGIPFFYVNQTGAQTELIFDGQSLAVNAQGDIYKMPAFEECMSLFDLEKVKTGEGSADYTPVPKMEVIYKALVEGISGYFSKLGFKKALLGMSGGIDSALVLALAVKALGKDNVLPVLMPSPYSSEGSISDALDMVAKVGTDHKIIPIAPVMYAYDEILAPHFAGLKPDITEENIQARGRGAILMALSNKLNHILLNTSNKSEIAVGYSTMYGDAIGALAVIGDLYKTEIYALCEYINQVEGPTIPVEIITKAPSAELRPDQKDSDSLPSYEILDAVLYQYIEMHQGPREIINMGFDKDLVYKVLKLVNQSEYKRYQAPPVLRVSDKSFGSGRRLPIVAKYLS